MHSFLSTQKLIAVKTKVSCGCQTWNSICKKHTKNFALLHQPIPRNIYSPCPIQMTRLFSNLVKTTSIGSYQYQCYSNPTPRVLVLPVSSRQLVAYDQRWALIPPSGLPSHVVIRHFHGSWTNFDKEPLKPSSKVEETVQALKDKETEKAATQMEKPPPVKMTLRQKVVHELTHYYHGFRLLFIDINVSAKLVWRILNGKTLTRREHRLLVRTVSDLFRLVPFSVFIIVPFMELLLPLAIKMFPGMLPSTFQTATEKDDKMKQSLKVKLEMAKFLQKTLDDMAVVGKGHNSESAREFHEFFVKLRTSGEQATNEEIMKFSKLFEDEITLDSLSRQQLAALCRVLEIQPLGTNNFLRFQLRMKLRSLAADDKVIEKEGIESLTPSELQQACRARGMRAYGMPTEKLRAQLAQWLELSLHHKVPPSLLLLSRALLLPDSIPTSDQLKATISVLPDVVATQAKAAIGEREGVVDNKAKIDIIKEEQRLIKEESREKREELKKVAQEDKEVLVDTAPVLQVEPAKAATRKEAARKELTSTDLGTLETALDAVSKDKRKLLVEKEELDDLKEELAEYKEDVDDLKNVLKTVDPKEKISAVHETKAAQRLYKKVNSMIGKMDAVLTELEREEKSLKKDLSKTEEMADTEITTKSQALVSIEELMAAIRQIQKVPDDSLLERINDVLRKMDDDDDGSIAVDDVLKVIELVGKENVKIGRKQLDEIIDLIDKEEKLELEGQIERALAKETQQIETAKQKQQMVADIEKELAAEQDSKKAEDKPEDCKLPGPMPPIPPPITKSSSASMSAAPPSKQSSVREPSDNQDKTKTL